MTGILAVALWLGAAPAAPGDWPQWRGAARDGVGAADGGFREWPSHLRRKWRTEVGSGQSSPVVSGGTVFLFTREGEEEVARALHLVTGEVRWRQAYPAPYAVYPGALSFGGGPKSTPVVHEGRLFTFGISGILTAFDATSGKRLWQKTFAGRFPATAPPFGTSMSPLVVSGRLIVHAGGHDGGALIAFDPATGEEEWVLEGEGPSYSSPIAVSLLGQRQIVLQVHQKVLGVDPATGRRLWSLPFVTPCDQNIVTPLLAGNHIVVSSLDKGTMAIRLARQGDRWEPSLAWQTQDVSMYMSTPVVRNGRVIGLSHRQRGQLFALDAETGAVRWKGAGGQGQNAAFVVLGDSIVSLQGDGRLLVLHSEGDALLTAASYEVAQSSTYAHPVPTSLGILVKDQGSLSLHAVVPGPSVGGAGH
jgi:outer membrane protein assembly factor BamB